jgi:hypothetical protein
VLAAASASTQVAQQVDQILILPKSSDGPWKTPFTSREQPFVVSARQNLFPPPGSEIPA